MLQPKLASKLISSRYLAELKGSKSHCTLFIHNSNLKIPVSLPKLNPGSNFSHFKISTSMQTAKHESKTKYSKEQFKWRWDFYKSSNCLAVGVGVLSSCMIQTPYHSDVLPIDTTSHELDCSGNFDSGLNSPSQRAEPKLFWKNKDSRMSSASSILRAILLLKYVIYEFVVDPLKTIARFIELGILLIPLVLASPVCWVGLTDKETSVTTKYGAQLWFQYLRWSAEAAGATFIKLGQWAASRTDIFPKSLCDELGHLHSNVKSHSLSDTKRILSNSFGMPFEDIFAEFDENPVGVGAIAQVYLARLSEKAIAKAKAEDNHAEHSDFVMTSKQKISTWAGVVVKEQQGIKLSSCQKVAIKVLHPDAEVKINRDLRIMSFLAKLINTIPTMEWLSLPDEVENFSTLMRIQLDLRIEALNLTKFRNNFRNRLDIHFPMPFPNFSSRNVLVEEYIKAVPMEKMLSLQDNFGKNLSKEVSDKGLDSFLQMLILDNFVHSDLHPGNMLVRFKKTEMCKYQKDYRLLKSSIQDTDKITEELLALGADTTAWCEKLVSLYEKGYHAEICFLDVGLITELDHDDRINFIDLFKALSEFDGYKAGNLMVERSRTPETVINRESFALKVEYLVDRMKERTFSLGSINIGDLLDQVLSMVRTHHVRMEGDFITVIVAILLLEGIGRQLDPHLDLFARFVY